MSSGEIVQCLSEDGVEIAIRTVERVLREEGFPKLPRRTRLKINMTVKGTPVYIPSMQSFNATVYIPGTIAVSASFYIRVVLWSVLGREVM